MTSIVHLIAMILRSGIIVLLALSLCDATDSGNSSDVSDETGVNSNPRIADVLQYMDNNGGVSWVEIGNGSRYVFHTYEEWAAAEKELAGDDIDSFISKMAVQPATSSSQPSDIGTSDKSSSASRTPHTRRDDSFGIDGGLLLNGQARDGRYYCYNKGQWAITTPFNDFVTLACNTVMRDGLPSGVHTWTSQGYHQLDHQVAAWFIQSSGEVGDTNAYNICKLAFKNFRQGDWCPGNNRNQVGVEGGRWTTQGGYIRWWNSKPGSVFGRQRGELRIDPNTCHADGQPCSNIDNVATNQR